MTTDELWGLVERLRRENAELRAENQAAAQRLAQLSAEVEVAQRAADRWARLLARSALNPAGQTSDFGPEEAKALAAFLRGTP